MRILLAMSGGVDSSTVAHLLKEGGHDVVGVRFILWTDPLAPALAQVLPTKCCSAQNIVRAEKVCRKLGIPLHVIDLSREFYEQVVEPYLKAHVGGLTPNPCIGCNRTIKFGKLLELLDEYNCERLATGHYARVALEEISGSASRHVLLEAIDKRKDQSYYLYGLSQKQLSKMMCPLGGMQKSEVYALARKYGVPLPVHYRESQDLCFFPEKTPQEFLKRHLGEAIRPGTIRRRDGTIVGHHNGAPLYTVGQRHGLKIGGLKVPLEIVEKRADRNELIVADQGAEKTTSLNVTELRWISWTPDEARVAFECRTRSQGVKTDVFLDWKGSNGVVTYSSPQPPQARGQSAVFYRGEEIVGGGTIA